MALTPLLFGRLLDAGLFRSAANRGCFSPRSAFCDTKRLCCAATVCISKSPKQFSNVEPSS